MPKQTYKTKATRGRRRRPGYKFTLDPKTDAKLDSLAAVTGLTRSRIVDELVRASIDGVTAFPLHLCELAGRRAGSGVEPTPVGRQRAAKRPRGAGPR